MAREPKDVDIEGVTYTITLMEPFKSFRIFTRLTKLMAPVGGKLAEAGLAKGAIEGDINSSAIVDMLEVLADRIDEVVLEKTLKELLEPVLVSGRKLIPEKDFLGDVPLMLKVAAEVIKAEYGGFLKFVPDLPSSGVTGAASK